MLGRLGPDALQIRKAYNAFDVQKRGYLELIEIKAILGSGETAATFSELVELVDPQGSGLVTFETFFDALTSGFPCS